MNDIHVYMEQNESFAELESLDELNHEICFELTATNLILGYEAEDTYEAEGVLEAIGNIIKKIFKFILDGLKWIKEKAIQLVNWISDHVKNIVTKFKVKRLEKFKDFISENSAIVNKIKTGLTIKTYKFKNDFTAVDTAVASVANHHLEEVNGSLDEIRELLSNVALNAEKSSTMTDRMTAKHNRRVGSRILRNNTGQYEIFGGDAENRFRALYMASGSIEKQESVSSEKIIAEIMSKSFVTSQPQKCERIAIPVKHLISANVVDGLINTIENMPNTYDLLNKDLKHISTAANVEISNIKSLQESYTDDGFKSKEVNKVFKTISGSLNAITQMFGGMGKVIIVSKNIQTEFIKTRYEAFNSAKKEMKSIISKEKK